MSGLIGDRIKKGSQPVRVDCIHWTSILINAYSCYYVEKPYNAITGLHNVVSQVKHFEFAFQSA